MKTRQELELLAAGVARLLAKGKQIYAVKLVREKTASQGKASIVVISSPLA